MELIRPSVEIWEQGTTLEDMWKHIARCTRVCYQSTPKNDGETDEEFVKRVILRLDSSTGELNFDKIHGAMLEHGTVYLLILNDERDKSVYKSRYENNKYSKVNYFVGANGLILDSSPLFITTNLRVIYENNWLNDLDFVTSPSPNHYKRVTVSFTTNIGVSREFNRHRVNSIAEESTRYCNYNKRNDGQIKIGLPAWLDNEVDKSYLESHQFDSLISYIQEVNDNTDKGLLHDWTAIDFYLFSLTVAEWSYNMLIAKGWKPQQAREVLPLATKTQLIHTAFVDDLKHFFVLRADGMSGPPHPNAAFVAKPLKEEFIKRGYI